MCLGLPKLFILLEKRYESTPFGEEEDKLKGFVANTSMPRECMMVQS